MTDELWTEEDEQGMQNWLDGAVSESSQNEGVARQSFSIQVGNASITTSQIKKLHHAYHALRRFCEIPDGMMGFLEAIATSDDGDDIIGIFADWLEERGKEKQAERMRKLRSPV